MTPQEWLKSLSQNGSNLSPSVLFALSLIDMHDEETLWMILILLSGCFSDLAKAGHITSLPPNLDLRTAALTFTHLSSTMDDAASRSSELGNTRMALPGLLPTIPEDVQ